MSVKLSPERMWFEVLVGGRPRGRNTLRRWVNRQQVDWIVENKISLTADDLCAKFAEYMHEKVGKIIAERAVNTCLEV